jgi:hypothetical protein
MLFCLGHTFCGDVTVSSNDYLMIVIVLFYPLRATLDSTIYVLLIDAIKAENS